jgi:hypothetical protein
LKTPFNMSEKSNSGRGGARPGAGRKKGPTKTTIKRRSIAEQALENGLTPLDYMLDRLRDEKEDPKVRQAMAMGAAPYVHPRLAAIEHSGGLDLGLSKYSDDELDAAIQRAAGEAAVVVGAARKSSKEKAA